MRLDHAQLPMPPGGEDLARSFYRDVLGMPEVPKPPSMLGNGGVWFRAGEAELHFSGEADFRPARKSHPALRVPDLDALAARCEAAGHPAEWDDRYPGVRRCYVFDPFGNRIELMQEGTPRWLEEPTAGRD